MVSQCRLELFRCECFACMEQLCIHVSEAKCFTLDGREQAMMYYFLLLKRTYILDGHIEMKYGIWRLCVCLCVCSVCSTLINVYERIY